LVPHSRANAATTRRDGTGWCDVSDADGERACAQRAAPKCNRGGRHPPGRPPQLDHLLSRSTPRLLSTKNNQLRERVRRSTTTRMAVKAKMPASTPEITGTIIAGVGIGHESQVMAAVQSTAKAIEARRRGAGIAIAPCFSARARR